MFVFLLTLGVITMFAAQYMLMSDESRSAMSLVEQLEEANKNPFPRERTGTITLKLYAGSTTLNDDNAVTVIQNGEVLDKLTDKETVVTVADNSIIQLDGSNCPDTVVIEISMASANVKYHYFASPVTVEGDIVTLARVYLE